MNLFENKKIPFPAPGVFIKDLQVGGKTDSFFKVFAVSKRSKKDGSPFLSLELMDKTGRIPAKIWDNAEHYFKILKEGDIFRINGVVNEYMGQKEIKIDGVRAVSPEDHDFDPADFQEKAAFDTTKMYDEMMALLKAHVTQPHLRQLLDLFVRDYGEKFKNHYGAQKVHHAYPGGLLDHTYSIIQLAVICAEHYQLDKDILLIGALFHDIGKMFEFNIEPAIDTTFAGGMLGHLVIGNGIFVQLSAEIPGFPQDLSCKIQHLIISHHGEKEFGSPEVPKIAEAFVLHVLDLLDSRLKIVEEVVEKTESKGLFSDYIHVLNRRLYLPPRE